MHILIIYEVCLFFKSGGEIYMILDISLEEREETDFILRVPRGSVK